MKCSRVTTFFDRMYRESDSFDHPEVIAHINACPECAAAYAQWRRIADSFSVSATPVEPPLGLTTRVVQAVADLDARKKPVFQLSFGVPSAALSLAAVVLVVAATLFVHTPQIEDRSVAITRPVSSPDRIEGPARIEPIASVVHFELTAADARQVALVGDFNQWNTEHTMLSRKNADTWTIDLPLGKGAHQYLFYIDGQKWCIDPARQDRVPDGFGGFNSVIIL